MILPYNWKEWLKPEPMRESMTRNSAVIGIIALVAAIVALAFIIRQIFPPHGGPVPQCYFYDTSNGTVSVRPQTDYPPLIGSTGQPTVVYAIYLTCSTCENKYLAYLQKYTPASQQMLNHTLSGKASTSYQGTFSVGFLVCRPDDTSNWYPAGSPEGLQIIQSKPCPNNQPPGPCLP
ncbi:MAG TPA: hypothetical protein VMG59_02200 [Phycisphaerae bacterium]|nr:hypothetical protein [Phycisphaerae bacterium]